MCSSMQDALLMGFGTRHDFTGWGARFINDIKILHLCLALNLYSSSFWI